MENQTKKITLGTWSWGVGMYGGDAVFGNKLGVAELAGVVEVAIANGINTFDTAYAYALGESEKIVGKLLSEYPREDVVISTKFTPGLQNDDAENPVIDMMEESLKRLGTETIDIYWIHNSGDIERFTPLFVEAFKRGKIKRVGISNHSLEQIKRVEEIFAPAGITISAVQNHFSLLYRSSIEDGLLDYCHEKGIEFFSYMVLEQGALSGKYNENNLLPLDSRRGARYNPMFPKLKGLLQTLTEIAGNYNATPAQIATAWAMMRGTTPILGMTNTKQVDEAVKASEIQLTETEMLRLETEAIASGVDTRGGWEGKA